MAVRLRRSARKGDKNEGDPAAANAAGQVSPAPQADQVVPEPPVVDVGEPVSPSSDQPASLAAPVPETLVAPAPPAGTAVTPLPAFPPMPPASPVLPVAVGQPAKPGKPAKGKGAPRPTRWALLTLAIGLATVAAAIAVVWRLPDVLTPQVANEDGGAKVAATVTSSAPCNQANARDGVELKVNDQTINAKLDGCGHNQGEIVEVQAPTRTDGEVVVTVAGVTPGGSGLLRPLTVLLFFLSALAGAVYAFLVRWRPGRAPKAPRAPRAPKPPKAPKAKTPRTGRKRGKKDQQPVSPLAPAAG